MKLSNLVFCSAAALLCTAAADAPYYYSTPEAASPFNTNSGFGVCVCVTKSDGPMKITRVDLQVSGGTNTVQIDHYEPSSSAVVQASPPLFPQATVNIPTTPGYSWWPLVSFADEPSGYIVIPANTDFCVAVQSTISVRFDTPSYTTGSSDVTLDDGVTASFYFKLGTSFISSPSTRIGFRFVAHSIISPSPTPSTSVSPSITPSASVSPSASPSASASASASPSTSPSPSTTPSSSITPTLSPVPCAVKTRYIRVQRPAQFPLVVDEVVALDASGARKNVASAAAVKATSTLLHDRKQFGPQFVIDGKINDPKYVAAGGIGAWQPESDLGNSEVLTLTWPGAGVRLSEVHVHLRTGGMSAAQRRALGVEVELNGARGCTPDFARGRISVANATGPWVWALPRPVLVKTLTLRRVAVLHIGELAVIGYPLEGSTYEQRAAGVDLLTMARQRGAVTASASSVLVDPRLSASYYDPIRAIDGKANTFWHSKFTDRAATFTLDLGAEYMVQRVQVAGRRDMGAHRTMGASVTLLDGAKQRVGGEPVVLTHRNYRVTGPQTGCLRAAAIAESYGWWYTATQCSA